MAPRSKPGEGIVIVVDVGPHVRASTDVSFYSNAKECLINILQRKIFADKCKDMVGIVLFGTNETNNPHASGDRFRHITVLQKPKLVDWDLLSLAQKLPIGNNQGDWLDALIVAIGLLKDEGGIFYSSKKVVLMTDFGGEFSDNHVTSLIAGFQVDDIELSVIGPSLGEDEDDVEMLNAMASTSNGDDSGHVQPLLNWNGKPKTRTQIAGETLIRRIVADVEGIACSFDEAIPQLIFFEKKTQASAAWNAMLDIGPSLKLPITGRILIKHATIGTWKKAYAADDTATIIPETSFHKHDEDWTKVEDEDVVYGYKYGTTLVPFGGEDEQLKYNCGAMEAQMNVIGFTRTCYIQMNMRAGDQVMVIRAKDGDTDGSLALSSIIQAMKELDMVAVARKIYRKGANPVFGALYPEITASHECLVWIGLPFMEDYRSFSYPSLEAATKALSSDEKSVMDQYMDSMDLSNEGDDEYFDPHTIVNPEIQHYFNCLTSRVTRPDDPLPGPAQHVQDILSVPEHLREARDRSAARLTELMPTIKIIKEKKKLDLTSHLTGCQSTSTVGDLLSSDLTRVVVTKIGSVTPAQDFKALLQGDPAKYISIFEEMSGMLLQMVEGLTGATSMDNILIPRVVEAIKIYREEGIMIEPGSFNDFIGKLKDQVQARGSRSLWDFIEQGLLGLISASETLKSKVSREEASEFLRWTQPKEEVEEKAPQVDYDDMLDDL